MLPAGATAPRLPHSTPLAAAAPRPDDPSAFMTALAAQERRVLELKEELGKAEAELRRLKRQWASHEASRSRYELAANGAAGGDALALASPTGREEFRRRQLQAQPAGTGKVLVSQRGQRALSLLAPEREVGERRRARTMPIGPPPAQSYAAPGMSAEGGVRVRPKSQDVLLKTGQQMAADFRDGLWTFLEDLKQATVGDDMVAAPAPAAMRRSSSSRSRGVARRVDKKRVPDLEEALIDFGDAGAAEPQSFRWSSSSASYSDLATSTPRTSTRFVLSFPERCLLRLM